MQDGNDDVDDDACYGASDNDKDNADGDDNDDDDTSKDECDHDDVDAHDADEDLHQPTFSVNHCETAHVGSGSACYNLLFCALNTQVDLGSLGEEASSGRARRIKITRIKQMFLPFVCSRCLLQWQK